MAKVEVGLSSQRIYQDLAAENGFKDSCVRSNSMPFGANAVPLEEGLFQWLTEEVSISF